MATKTETVKKKFSFPLLFIFLLFPFFFFLSKEEKKRRERAKHLSHGKTINDLFSLSLYTLSNHLDFGERIDVDAPYPSPTLDKTSEIHLVSLCRSIY